MREAGDGLVGDGRAINLPVAWESRVVCMGEIVNMATAMPMSRSETGERIIDTFTKVR